MNQHQQHKGVLHHQQHKQVSHVMSTQPLVISPKDNPMQIDKTRFKPFKEQKK